MIHGVAEAKCAACPNMTGLRSREEIARGLRSTIATCLLAPNGLKALSSHLWWLEGELLGLCVDCVRARAAQFHADAQAAMSTPTPSPFLQPRLRVVGPEGA